MITIHKNKKITIERPAGLKAAYALQRKLNGNLKFLPAFHTAMIIQTNSPDSYAFYRGDDKTPLALLGVHHHKEGSDFWMGINPDIGKNLLAVLRSDVLKDQLKKSPFNLIRTWVAADNLAGQRMAKLSGFKKHQGKIIKFNDDGAASIERDFDLWEYF